MDYLDVDGVLGDGYYQFGYMGNSQFHSQRGFELERGHSYRKSLHFSDVQTSTHMVQIVVGTTCVAIPMVLNGAIGAKLHIPFSVAIRASFGYYFAYFAICSRAILAMFWLGIQGASGAQCLTIMLTAIWPSYANIPDALPKSAGISTQGMIRYAYWVTCVCIY